MSPSPPLPTGQTSLTPRQRDCLDAIAAHEARAGTMPSLEELRLALGVTSKSGVQRLLLQLEARGALTRAPRRTRAMQLTGAAVCPRCRAAIGEEARPAP